MKIIKLAKDYKIPLTATALFLIIVALLLVLRIYERVTIGAVLANNSDVVQGYSRLFSADSVENFEKNSSDNSAEVPQEEENTTFTVSTNNEPEKSTSNNNSSSSNDSDSSQNSPATSDEVDDTSQDDDSTDTPDPTPPPEPFEVEALSVHMVSASNIKCSSYPPSLPSDCYRLYTLQAQVYAENGPGNVTYQWRWFLPNNDPISEGSYNAVNGESITDVQKVVKVLCSTPESPIEVRFKTKKPTSSQVNTGFHHHCSGEFEGGQGSAGGP